MIDPRAEIHPSARIAKSVTIGPWTIIGPDVEIGENTRIGPHVVINGPTKIGENNKIFQFSSIGEDPQDKKYNGEKTVLEIGSNNTIREYCTLNRGTVQGGGITKIGNDNLFMAYVHIAHDCIVGNKIVFSNNAALAGHVVVSDNAILGGFTGVHQFCKIGHYSFIGKGAFITKDVPPYIMVAGEERSASCGVNIEGLKRHGFSSEAISALRKAYKIVYRKGLLLKDAIGELKKLGEQHPEIELMYEFLLQSERGIIR